MFKLRKKIATFLVLVLLFQMFPITTTYSLDYNNIWDIQITNIQSHKTLETIQNVTLYGGETQVTTFLDSPEKGSDQFLLVELKVEKIETIDSSFDISKFTLSLEEESYAQKDATFLYDHNLTPFPQNEILFGTTYGYILFEVPETADLSTGFLNDNQFQIPLQLSVSLENESNIQVIENTLSTQKERDEEILSYYVLNEYSLTNPFVVLNPYKNAPLSALILFETESPAIVSIQVEGKTEHSHIFHTFETENTHHQIPIVGLYPDYENQVHVTISYADGKEEMSTMTIETAPLYDHQYLLEMELVSAEPEKMEEGLTFLNPTSLFKYPLAVDCEGEIRWILTLPALQNLSRLENGNLFSVLETSTELVEFDLLGKFHNIYFDPQVAHHDVIELPSGNLLTTSRYDDDYFDDRLIELDRNSGEVVWDFDIKSILDPLRFNEGDNKDWLHLNSVYFDESDQSILISGRHQGVFKISYPKGELIWMLTIDEELESLGNSYLSPIGDDFKAPYSQHAAMIMTDQDNNTDTLDIMLFDNNLSYIDMPIGEFDRQYSRLVQYRIDEKNMTVEEIWSFGEELGYEYFGDIVGDADFLESGTVLGTFGRRNFFSEQDDGTDVATIFEVDKETDEIVYELNVISKNNEAIYRADRYPLYPSQWDFYLNSGEGEIKAQNAEYIQMVSTCTSITPLQPQGDIASSINANFNKLFDTLDVSGIAHYLNDVQDYNTADLIIQSQEAAISIPLENRYDSNFTLNFSVSIPRDLLMENLPNGSYTIGLLLDGEAETAFQETVFFFPIVANTPTVTTIDILEEQYKMAETLKTTFESDVYTFKEPLVVVDPFEIAPLSAIVLFETEEPSKITVTVEGLNGGQTFSQEYSTFETVHQIPIYGLYEQKETTVTLEATNQKGVVESTSFSLAGNKLPSDLLQSKVLEYNHEEMAEGLTFFSNQDVGHYFYGIDYTGDVRFALSRNSIALGSSMELLENGNLLVLSDKTMGTQYYKESLYEMDFTGKIITEYLHNGAHHEAIELKNGNFLVGGNTFDGSTLEDAIYELSRSTGEIVRSWDADDFFPVDSYDEEGVRASSEVYGFSTHDWFHLNSLDEHPETGDILMSARYHDVVISLNPDSGEINYIIGDHDVPVPVELEEKLLKPIGDDFHWQYGQHDAKFLPNGDILLFDNGSYRSKTSDAEVDAISSGFSCAIIYRVDEENRTIEKIWSFGEELGSDYLSTYLSNVQYLGENHYLINFGGILYDENGKATYDIVNTWFYGSSSAKQIEVKDDEIIFEAEFSSTQIAGNVYRSKRMTLYNSDNYPDIFTKAQRLGSLQSYGIAEISDIPTDLEPLDLYVSSVIDNGVQLEYEFQMKNGYLEGENFLYFLSDVSCYKVALSTGTNISGVINKVEIPKNNYALFLQNGDLLLDLNLNYIAFPEENSLTEQDLLENPTVNLPTSEISSESSESSILVLFMTALSFFAILLLIFPKKKKDH